MDLVDIDKVLDDLELNEGDGKGDTSLKITVSTRAATILRDDYAPEAAACEISNLLAKASGSGSQKRFVGVSQVLSSLSDYQKDVESLEAGIKRLETIPTIDAECDESATMQPHETVDRGDSNYDDDDFVSEDLDPIDGDCLTLSSSITTSSPSSFSSGPSPRGNSADSTSLSSEGSGGAQPSEYVAADIKADGHAPLPNNSEKTVEMGLSSISSCFYKENTLSSLPGFSQDIMQSEDLSTTVSLSQTTQNRFSDGDDEEEEGGSNEAGILNPAFEHTSSDPVKAPANRDEEEYVHGGGNVPPVTFGSTMDEISDTELDSMLQEIDSELQTFYNPSLGGPIEKPEQPSEEEEGDAVVVETTKTDNTSSSNASLSRRTESDENHQNADSFSQASTIEFAELPLQNDFVATVAATTMSGTTDPPENPVKEEPAAEIATENVGEEPAMTQLAAAQPPQRPNSLDLQQTNQTEVGAVAGNLYASAGQTPPASRVDDPSSLSTSSLDDISNSSREAGWNAASGGQQPSNGTGTSGGNGSNNNNTQLGKVPPFWIPDSEANACMQCKQKFSLLKRRHHCRACGQVLCSICCSQKAKLEFLGDAEQRVCVQCHLILSEMPESGSPNGSNGSPSPAILGRSPNPNNPMEYCSMIPPHQQVTADQTQTPISVMVPVGVLKREGAPKNPRKEKTVIFSDGIRPGCDLAALDNEWDDVPPYRAASSSKSPAVAAAATAAVSHTNGGGVVDSMQAAASRPYALVTNEPQVAVKQFRTNRKGCPPKDENDSFISKARNGLPPMYVVTKTECEYKQVQNNAELIERLQKETLKFAVQRNLYVYVKIVKLKCCVNKTIINFTTFGMHHVGQDEIIILLELDDSELIPKDIFVHLNEIYNDADKGQPISELGFSTPKSPNFLGKREHGGFLYIRPTFQCLQEIQLPESPYLIGILIHRWEVPWAKIFPLRLMLRLGAQYRYYPSPQVSIRGRDSVYAEIAQTIINFLADFRNYSYTLATIKGMHIHMEDRKTSVLIPKNRYDQIVKALNNSSDHILALGGNFSKKADGHLVCIQNLKTDCADSHSYSTQAINIQGQPRKVTGASFIVLNGALKTTSGLSGKCSIVEDGLMVQILPAKMTEIRNALKNIKDIEIVCGPVDADESMTELVSIKWTDNDVEFNIGVVSPIDGRKMDGVPSIRVHSGLNYSNSNHVIRWTEVFIIQSDEESAHGKDPIDMSKLSEQIARSTSIALVSFLDLLAAGGCIKLGLRATLSQDNVSYDAGSNSKLPPLYMKALDNELIPTLHKQATMLEINTSIVLELIFHILDK